MADLSELFNYLTGYSNQVEYRELLVAPLDLRRRLRALLERETAHAGDGQPAHVVIKVNGLSDRASFAICIERPKPASASISSCAASAASGLACPG